MEFEVDLLTVHSWADFHMYFRQQYGFTHEADNLSAWIAELKRMTETESIFIIKNPMLVYGDSNNLVRDTILQMVTVVNSERYAAGEAPTIKLVFK